MPDWIGWFFGSKVICYLDYKSGVESKKSESFTLGMKTLKLEDIVLA